MIVVTPLPDIDPFTVTLRVDKLTGTKGIQAASITAIDTDGKNIRNVVLGTPYGEFDAKKTLAKFQTRKNEFAYQVLLSLGLRRKASLSGLTENRL